MQTVSSAVMRELDRRTIAAGVPGELLMERAGLGMADAADGFLFPRPAQSSAPPWILLIAGHGNNGGDVFAAARHLQARGRRVEVWLAAEAGRINGDAKIHLERMRSCGVRLREMPQPPDWAQNIRAIDQPPPAVIVDGLLGTGSSGAPRGVMAAAIEFINRHQDVCRILAVDVPSGLNADDGTAAGAAVRADLTVTMGLPKTGLLQPAALEYVGALRVADIGIPASLVPTPAAALELITPADLALFTRRRPRGAHKGDYGHLLIIAGARGYAGAAILAARAALRSGVGLVSVLTPRGIRAEVAAAVPEAMVHGAPENLAGSIGVLDDQWRRMLAGHKFTALLAGPGLTPHPDTAQLVMDLTREFDGPLALDADALNVLAGRLPQVAEARIRQTAAAAPLVITPHPGEMARLLQTSSAAVQADRFTAARTAARQLGGVVVLKGAGTLVAVPDRPVQVNLTGNPGMAKGGSGDVLAGLISGLLGWGLAPFDAARAAVYLHGRAGDHAARRLTETAMAAGDMIDCLPQAWAELSAR